MGYNPVKGAYPSMNYDKVSIWAMRMDIHSGNPPARKLLVAVSLSSLGEQKEPCVDVAEV